ncbi:MAG: proline iminopeptidase-family hydrolase [Candidatus Nanopelagicales bacterium]|nr:proline iminopeptidase-family hydrolase [Candidatus Nanopelagicales bacterium]
MHEQEMRLSLIPELGETWCRVVGEGDRTPIVLLHGGPGYNSEYLRRFENFAKTGRPVIRYDQIGSGRSIVADEHYRPGVFTVELFRRELSRLREELGLDEVILIGQSWGVMLALEHAIEGAPGIRALVLMSGPASMEEWTAETLRLRAELPPDVRETLAREEAAGRVGSPAFKEAYAVWERTHVLRMDEPPPWEAEGLEIFERDMRVYDLTTGGAEFPTEGTTFELADWDIRPLLGKVSAPTLLLSGRYDEATPAVMSTLLRGIAGSEWHILEESSHSCHTEEEALTMLLVADFLARTEGGGR